MMSEKSFENKTIFILGATSGIGYYLAKHYAKLGANLIIAGRSDQKLHMVHNEIKSATGSIKTEKIDVCDENYVAGAFKNINNWLQNQNSKMDIAINCAGLVKNGEIDTMTNSDFKQMINTNLYGVWLCMKEEIALMKPHKNGSIINIASNIGLHSIRPLMGGYGATKAALTILSQTSALEVLPFNLRVHTLSPGPFDTKLSYRSGEDKKMRDIRIFNSNPSKRVGTLLEIAETIKWLSQSPHYLVGQDIIIDGGASL